MTIVQPAAGFPASRHGLDSRVAGKEQMVTDNTPQPSGLFGVYLQASDLDRSLSFYRDMLALEVVWNDGALAVLHSHRAPPTPWSSVRSARPSGPLWAKPG